MGACVGEGSKVGNLIRQVLRIPYKASFERLDGQVARQAPRQSPLAPTRRQVSAEETTKEIIGGLQEKQKMSRTEQKASSEIPQHRVAKPGF